MRYTLAISLLLIGSTAWGAGPKRRRPARPKAPPTLTQPRPVIDVKVNGRAYDGVRVISKKSTITVSAKPARGARGRYELASVTLYARRSLGGPSKVADFVGEGDSVRAALGNNLKQDSPGTVVYLKLGKLRRRSSAATLVEVPIPARERWIAFVIK